MQFFSGERRTECFLAGQILQHYFDSITSVRLLLPAYTRPVPFIIRNDRRHFVLGWNVFDDFNASRHVSILRYPKRFVIQRLFLQIGVLRIVDQVCHQDAGLTLLGEPGFKFLPVSARL